MQNKYLPSLLKLYSEQFQVPVVPKQKATDSHFGGAFDKLYIIFPDFYTEIVSVKSINQFKWFNCFRFIIIHYIILIIIQVSLKLWRSYGPNVSILSTTADRSSFARKNKIFPAFLVPKRLNRYSNKHECFHELDVYWQSVFKKKNEISCDIGQIESIC